MLVERSFRSVGLSALLAGEMTVDLIGSSAVSLAFADRHLSHAMLLQLFQFAREVLILEYEGLELLCSLGVLCGHVSA